MKAKLWVAISLALLLLTGCGSLSEEEIRGTVQAEFETAQYISGLETAAADAGPADSSDTAEDEASPSATATPTGEQAADTDLPQLSVIQATNCRTGPGANYDYVSTVEAGEVREVVGLPADPNIVEYVLVSNRPNANPLCWLWLRYADTKDFSAYSLPSFFTPPTPTASNTPTPTITSTPTISPTITETLSTTITATSAP